MPHVTANPSNSDSPRRRLALSLIAPTALIALTLLAFAPALRGGFIWDDDDYVTENANLHTAAGLASTWSQPRSSPQYYPMVFTTFWLEYQLWYNHPLGYHLDNVLLHALAAILLWRVLRRLDIPAAFVAACLFAVHPVNVESVAWITERKNVLSAVFYFAAALAFLRGRHVLCIVLFAAALLSKSVTCSLPAALLLVLWWKGRKPTRREIVTLAVMFALGLAMALTTAWLEVAHVHAAGREWDLSPIDRLLIAGRAVWFYAQKLGLPVNLSFIYPKWTIEPAAVWQWAFPIGVAVAVFVLWRMRDRWGRGPLVAVLFFIGTLLPALGFFNVYPMRYSYVADHFAYHASVGLIVLLALALCRLLGRAWPVALVPLVALTMLRANVYRDDELLWRDTLSKNADSWMVHLNLAKVLESHGKIDEAKGHFLRQVELGPNMAETHFNLGVNLARQRRLEEALAEYDRTLELDPSFYLAYFGRGNVFLLRHDPVQASAEYRRALQLNPHYAEAHYNLGLMLEAQGDLDGALAEYEKAIRDRPDYAEAHNYFARALVRKHLYPQAMEHYLRALAIRPDFAEAHLNLASLLAASGRMDEARQQFDQAVRLDPSLLRFADQVFQIKN
jgi:tetratricopeptide (TPR) repeat protein